MRIIKISADLLLSARQWQRHMWATDMCFSVDNVSVIFRFVNHPPEITVAVIVLHNEEWASYQIRKIAGCACAGNAGNVFPRRRFQRKPLVGDPGMHHGTCVTHVPWCMSGSLICGDGENVPGIPGACAPATLRIWQEAHGDALGYREHLNQHQA